MNENKASNFRVWLFRIILIIAGGWMAFTFTQMWWSGSIEAIAGGTDAIAIYPYAFVANLDAELSQYIADAKIPSWFTPVMWAYFGICMLLLLYSLFAKDKVVKLGKFSFAMPQTIIGVVGFSYIVAVVCAMSIIAVQCGHYFDLPLQGHTYVVIVSPWESYVDTAIKPGYWMACSAGPLLLVLALLRNKIIGKVQN
jgi:hypothetical protein